jgi:hypothetical protein
VVCVNPGLDDGSTAFHRASCRVANGHNDCRIGEAAIAVVMTMSVKKTTTRTFCKVGRIGTSSGRGRKPAPLPVWCEMQESCHYQPMRRVSDRRAFHVGNGESRGWTGETSAIAASTW